MSSIYVVYRYETETDSITPMKAREADQLYSHTDARSGSTFIVESSDAREALLVARCLVVIRRFEYDDLERDLELDLLESNLAIIERARRRSRGKIVSYCALRDLEADLGWW
jgi:hypothetical protein